LRDEWDESDEEVGGDVAYALACGSRLIEEEGNADSYYTQAVAAYDRDGEAVRAGETLFEQLAFACGHTASWEWEERYAELRQRVNARQLAGSYLHYLNVLKADAAGEWDTVSTFVAEQEWTGLRHPYGSMALLLGMKAAIAAQDETALRRLTGRMQNGRLAAEADIDLQFEWACLQGEMASAKGDWRAVRQFLAHARAAHRMGLPPKKADRMDKLSQAAAIGETGEAAEAAVPPEPGAWHVKLFGALTFIRDGEEISDIQWKRKKTKELLLFLLLQPDYSASRETVAEALFPESEPDKMTNQLYVCAHQLKQVIKAYLDADAGITLKDGTVRLKNGMIDVVDVERYFAMMRVGNRLWLTDRELAAGMYEKAVPLYGAIAPEVQYADWLDRFREQALEKQVEALRKLSAYAAERSQHGRAEAHLRDWIRLQPLREEAYQELLRVLMVQDKKSEAGNLFKHWEHLCRAEIGTDPVAETRNILRR
jgi:DNA-binding SARP family transcriptional activator